MPAEVIGPPQPQVIINQGPPGPAGVVPVGTWSPSRAYAAREAVHHLGSSWWATEASQGVTPGTGPQWQLLAAGATGAVPAFRHVQAAPADVWVIDHALGFRPNVTVTDSAGTSVEGDVAYVDDDTVEVTFGAAFAGEAYLS